MNNKHEGSTFDSFLEEEGILEEVEEMAAKKLVAYELDKQMKKEELTKTELARRLNTSRSAIDLHKT